MLLVGELYATQFFSSRKLKFLLLLSPSDTNNENLVRKWKKVSDRYQTTAIFTYITSQTFQDIYDYFNIIPSKDLPTIAAYNPSTDSKYKATNLLHDEEMEIGEKHLKSFVQGVIDGKITKILKTEPIPRESSNNGYVKKSVGKNILDVVSQENKDVLVLIYTPFCDRCKKILPTFDLLGRALQGDSRLALYKIDGSLNDLPSTFLLRQGSQHQNPNNNNNQISYPLLLWFPAKDKPYVNDDAIPRSYWNDAGYSLQELYSFIKRESSFDPQTLKIATIEQIGSLLADEEMYRLKYENEEKVLRRNEGRIVYDNEYLDWFIGEVVYDGKRWHLATAIFFGTTWILMGFSLLYLTVFASSPTKDVVRKEVEQDGNSDEQTEDDQQSIQQAKDKNE
jgi:thiol-disulfide isomerase/thioredoxin